MLKVPNRTQRSKGFKVKHVIQACLLFAICIWLLNQIKHSYDKKKAYVEGTGTLSEEVLSKHETIKLGRKDLDPQVQASTFKIRGNAQKEDLGDTEETKHEESEDEGRGVGDDEIDGHDREKAEDDEPEEVEDLIDEEDREREGESEEEAKEKGHRSEDASSLGDQAQYEGERNSREAREEHYNGDDASSAVVQNTHTTSNLFESGGLRKVKEEETENTKNVKLEQEKKKRSIKENNIDMNGSVFMVGNSTKTEYGGLRNPEQGEDKDNEFNLAISDIGSSSNSSIEVEANEKPELKSNSRLILMENLSSINGIGILSERIRDANVTCNSRQTFSQAVVREQNGKSGRTVENEPSNVNFNLTLSTMIVNFDAAKRDMAANVPSESVIPEQIVKLNTDELLASSTKSKNIEAAQNESLDSSDSSFYEDD